MAAPTDINMGSFRKKSVRKRTLIPGTKPSIINSQLLASTGIPSLDNILGGGIAVGSVLLIEEDAGGRYSRLMLQMFLAEGVTCKHALFFASGDVAPLRFIQNFPEPIIHSLPSEMPPGGLSCQRLKNEGMKAEDDDLMIAWRYKNLSLAPSSQSMPQFGHYYDLSKKMDHDLLDAVDKTLFDPSSDVASSQNEKKSSLSSSYARLLDSISAKVSDGNFGTNSQRDEHNILRIGIHSLGSPQWDEKLLTSDSSLNSDPSIFCFLFALRSIVRSAYTVALVTLPSDLFQNSSFASRLERLGDTVVRLESFFGTPRENNPALANYKGLFHVVKMPRLNCLACHDCDTQDLAFKVRRKRFNIEKLHLPPAISETSPSSGGHEKSKHLFAEKEADGGSAFPCGSSSSQSKLDF